MSEDNEIYIVCGQCQVKISGPTQEVVNIAFRGHEKEAHNYMTGSDFYERFERELATVDLLDRDGALRRARRAAGLGDGDE